MRFLISTSALLAVCACSPSGSSGHSRATRDARPLSVRAVDSIPDAAQVDVSSLLHLTYVGGSLPAGLKWTAGWVLAPAQDSGFSITDVEFKGHRVLLLERRIGRRGNQAIFAVADALALPATDTTLALVGFECSLNGQPDGELVTLLRYDAAADTLRDIRKAWRANTATRRFEAISVARIACRNESYGLP
jgi:hypothetical protein